jgi:S-adenosyl methyltransferase
MPNQAPDGIQPPGAWHVHPRAVPGRAGLACPSQAEAQRRYNERVSTPQTLRTRAEVSRFFEGLDLVPPGLVYVHEWRPGPDDIVPPGGVSAYGGVARKP